MQLRWYWFNECKSGQTIVFDEEHPGRQIEVIMKDMVNKIHDVVLAKHRIKFKGISDNGHI